MDEIGLSSTLGQARYECIGRCYMIAIGAVENDVSIGSFGGEELSAVKRAVDEADLRILDCDFGALVAVSYERSHLKIWISVCNSIEDVASDVARRAGADD